LEHLHDRRLWQDTLFSCKEIADRCGNFLRMSLECEVAGVEKVDGRSRNVASEGYGSSR
jgi:hypothetical protein